MTADGPRLLMPRLSPSGGRAGDGEYAAFALPATFGETPPMVELRLGSGNRVGLPYAWLSEVGYDPSEGVTLTYTTGVSVAIRGRNLGPVYAALVAQQAVYVRAADPPTAELAGDELPVVTGIDVRRTATDFG